MTAAAGLLLAFACLAIVGTGLALAVTAWRPGTAASPAAACAIAASLTIGGGTLLLTALHWLTRLLT